MVIRASKIVAAICAIAFLLATSWAEPVREQYVVHEYEDVDEISSLLESLVPGLKLEAAGRSLTLTAISRESMEQALELLHQLDRPLARISLQVQLVGLSPSEQELLGIQWHQAAIGTSWGVQLLPHFIGSSPKTLTSLPGSLPSQEKVAKSGQTANFSWEPPQNLDLGVDLDVRANVRSDNYLSCTLVTHTRLRDRVVESTADLRTRSGESIALRNLFPSEARLPAFSDLPALGNLFKPPSEPILIFTPKILSGGDGN
ncbi:hypothetical protein JST97_33060 [bacterium]|nr:hypothetical protein [bacterium]